MQLYLYALTSTTIAPNKINNKFINLIFRIFTIFLRHISSFYFFNHILFIFFFISSYVNLFHYLQNQTYPNDPLPIDLTIS
jgi:hypothetical protein